MPQTGHGAGFLTEAFAARVIGIGRQHLEGDEAILDLIVCPVNAGRAAAAETLAQHVPPNSLVGQGGPVFRRGIQFCIDGLRGPLIAPGFWFSWFRPIDQAGRILLLRKHSFSI